MAGYISKDFIHYGCGLILNPDKVWSIIPYSVKKNIKKAERAYVKIERKYGSPEDFDILKNMWYDPSDPNLPTKLNSNDIMYIAYLDNEPIGVMILLEIGNHLFLNNLAANIHGKEHRVQDYLLWFAVNNLKDTKYSYIDVGVSYRKNLYDFFKKWQTISYPVIFNKPKLHNPIRLAPFEKYIDVDGNNKDIYLHSEQLIHKLLQNREFTFVPNIDIADNICKLNKVQYLNATFNTSLIDDNKWYIIDLSQIFSVQFGALIINQFFDDKQLWNDYRSQDIFKREFVYITINSELNNFDKLIKKREENYNYFKILFSIDDIEIININEDIKSAFYFTDINNLRYSNKLNEFDIEHYLDKYNNIIGLPIHQNLNKTQLDLIYGIYRGILNLCSEWVHTDYYSDLK